MNPAERAFQLKMSPLYFHPGDSSKAAGKEKLTLQIKNRREREGLEGGREGGGRSNQSSPDQRLHDSG